MQVYRPPDTGVDMMNGGWKVSVAVTCIMLKKKKKKEIGV